MSASDFTESGLVVTSSLSGKPAIEDVALAFEDATGVSVRVRYNADPRECDVVIASSDAMERQHIPAGAVEPDGVVIGRMGVGVGIRPGAPVPDLSGIAQLTNEILEADAVLITELSSGIYAESMLKTLGVHERVKMKLRRYPDGPALMDGLLGGSGREFAISSANELRAFAHRGVILVGGLPAEVQYVRDYFAVPSATSAHKELAWEFVRFCGGRGRAILAAAGFNFGHRR